MLLTGGLGTQDESGLGLVINIVAAPLNGPLSPTRIDGVLNPIVELRGVLIEDRRSGELGNDGLSGSPGSRDLTGDL